MRLIAELTMPNRGSWNGQWSGQEDKYTVSLNVGKKKAEELKGHYYYNFGDGWGANVQIREPQKKERATGKFCGYEWMIESIRLVGKIVTSDQLGEAINELSN
jgi:hypothetical protein